MQGGLHVAERSCTDAPAERYVARSTAWPAGAAAAAAATAIDVAAGVQDTAGRFAQGWGSGRPWGRDKRGVSNAARSVKWLKKVGTTPIQ